MFATPSPEQRSRAKKVADDLGALAKAAEKAPSIEDLKEELGDAVTATVDADGQVNGTIHGHEAVMRAWEMQKGYHFAKSAVAEKMSAEVPKVVLRSPEGSLHVVPDFREGELAVRKGMRRAFVPGRRRRLRDGERLPGRVPFGWEREY